VYAYHFLPNYETLGIQHIDRLLKLLDEETILLARAPIRHPGHEWIEMIADQLAKLSDARTPGVSGQGHHSRLQREWVDREPTVAIVTGRSRVRSAQRQRAALTPSASARMSLPHSRRPRPQERWGRPAWIIQGTM
jgi:hypothetical protein